MDVHHASASIKKDLSGRKGICIHLQHQYVYTLLNFFSTKKPMASKVSFILKNQNYINCFFSSENLHFHILFLLLCDWYIVALLFRLIIFSNSSWNSHINVKITKINRNPWRTLQNPKEEDNLILLSSKILWSFFCNFFYFYGSSIFVFKVAFYIIVVVCTD